MSFKQILVGCLMLLAAATATSEQRDLFSVLEEYSMVFAGAPLEIARTLDLRMASDVDPVAYVWDGSLATRCIDVSDDVLFTITPRGCEVLIDFSAPKGALRDLPGKKGICLPVRLL